MSTRANITNGFKALAIAGLVSMLIACGGGSGSGGGTDISFGTVTDFGSIILNNSRLDDSSASVTLDGIPGSGSHGGLQLGMVVKASGRFGSSLTSTASTIEFRDNLEGPVCSLASPIFPPITTLITLRVLGQTVILNAATFVDNSTMMISEGDIVEVSGLPNEMEEIVASFIQVKDPNDAVIEVKGFVDTVNGFILTINDLEADFSPPAVIDNNIPGGVPAVDQFVEVKGTISGFTCGGGSTNSTDTLIATKVELEPEGVGVIPAGASAQVEGFITELTSDGFKIDGQAVVTTGDTLYLPEDFDASFLVVGAKVKVRGSTNSNAGPITATQISFRRNVKLESDVATIIDTNSFTLEGLPGITIMMDSNTEITSGATPAEGLHIRVRGIEVPGPGNIVLATLIDDQSGHSDAFLQGSVDNEIGGGTEVTVLGITVDTNTIFQFEDVNDLLITSEMFLDRLAPGTLVKFKGSLSGSTIVYDEAELED